ncbi:threonine synthase [soil metagenome]
MQLICSRCGAEYTASADLWRCTVCAGPLEWNAPETFDRSMIDTSQPGFWRYWRAFPVSPDGAVTFNETFTPLVPIDLDGIRVNIKLDGQLPTGSFKDRGTSVLLSFLAGEGVSRVVEDSSGNAAASVAGYAARAGIECEVYAPATASPGKLVQADAYGATVIPISGTRDDVSRAAEIAAEQSGNAYATHNWHPFFVEGVKSWAFEVWEQLGFEAPDAVIAPAGSGSIVLGAFRAFSALKAGGEIQRLPRVYAAQALSCAPLVAAIGSGADETSVYGRQPSLAEGIMIANPVRGRELLLALRASNGGAVSVEEAEIKTALIDLAHKGIYVEPTSATAIGAWRKLVASGQISASERVVVLLTGNGLKATSAISELLRAE